MKLKSAFLIVLTLVSSSLFFSNVYAIGEYGAQFLRIGVGSKATAMGEAFVSIADDPSAIYWNPAGMAQIRSVEIMGMHNFWLLDMTYQYFAAVFPTGIGAFGFALSYSSSGEIPKYENFQYLGEFSAYDAAGTIAYANNFGKVFSFGIGIKFIKQSIEAESASGFAIDIGLLNNTVEVIKGIRIGFAIQNLGPGIKFIEQKDPLPFNVTGGISYKIGPFTFTSDFNKLRDNDVRLNFGGEVLVGNILALRAGTKSNNTFAYDRFSAGFGLNLSQIDINYSYVPYQAIDNSHQVSLRIKF